MKVLFAVNNDKISEAVIKKYPKEYKELLSYKNVYYFNAILKEIQNDKSYDRIVISEDLEPFVNTNHDSIDNFLFNHLDKISDEAQGNDGKEISIILICSERRTFGSNILNKLFSIGIYNALIGNDRSMDNLCKLINRPRTKKEAKVYYRIDQATYESAVDNGEVSETEIQNILNHFKKLGKSTDRYTDSFNNIAAQYTDDQLKLIVNVLPMKVKAVLEAESDKYQSLMGTSSDERRTVAPVESGISVNTIGSGREPNINGPIVIPSGVKRFTGGARPIVPNNTASKPQPTPKSVQQPVQQSQRPAVQAVSQQKAVQQAVAQQRPTQSVAQNQVQQRPVQTQPVQQPQVAQVRKTPQAVQGGPVIPKNMAQRVSPVAQNPVVNQPVAPVVEEEPEMENPLIDDLFVDEPVEENEIVENPMVEEEETNDIDELEVQEEPVAREQPLPHEEGKRYTGTIAQVKRTLIARRKVNPVPAVPSVPEVEEVDEPEEEAIEEPRRGRGRPRKIVPEEELNKPKGKRGRPRKNAPEEENNLDDLLGEIGNSSEEEVMMPGVEEDVLPGLEENEEILPGLDDSSYEEEPEETMLPGMEYEEETELPGLDDIEEDNGVLPGVEEDNDEGEEVDVNSLLAGLDDDTSTSLPGLEDEVEDDGILPGLDDTEENDGMLPGLDSTDDEDFGAIPGLDDTEEDDGMLPGLDGTDDENFGAIPGLDDIEEDDGMLPGLDNADDEDFGAIPGLDGSNYEEEPEEETMLPGMGFDEEDEDPFATNNNASQESNAIESIKPQIDYSMSNLNSLLSKDKKIVAFLGATKNGTSFLINNLALMFSMMGIDVAILDMTQNKNSYYLFTDSREELRKIAYTSLSKLENGYADGIKFNKNLTVYTGLPSDDTVYENAEPILSTLVQNHSLILIDTDFTTPPAYFASSQEIYLVQSMDILTIQPLTSFLRDLKFKGAWEPEKARVVINKEVPIRILSNKTIIGGMSRYNGPDMSVMTDLFNKDMVKACSIPFDEKVYAKYLETLATCKLSISSLPKQFRAKLQILGEMVYPRLNSKTNYSPSPDMGGASYNPNGNAFSNDTNNILNKMKKKF
ncbi:MAG: hypothetical protein IJ629_00295 [Clostridia bacterium]|nr:hypothetical protein [Clostridia bacterium]